MNQTAKLTIAFFAGLAIGGGLGYVVTKSYIQKTIRAEADAEIQSVKDHYRLLNKEDYPNPTDFQAGKYEEDLEEARGQLEELGYAADESDDQTVESRVAARASILESKSQPADHLKELDEMEERTKNIWDEKKITAGEILETLSEEDLVEGSDRGVSFSDYKTLKMQDLMDQRTNNSDDAYVITSKEFDEDDKDWDRITLNYYAGDDVLCENHSDPIPEGEVERLIGPDALTNFGVGSKNDAIVYVRNPREGVETLFEIVKDERDFTEAVLGYKEPKVNHKFREDD